MEEDEDEEDEEAEETPMTSSEDEEEVRRPPRKSESQKKKKRLRESWEYSGPKVRPKRSAKPVKHNDTETEEEEEKVPYRKRAAATKPAIISDPGEF